MAGQGLTTFRGGFAPITLWQVAAVHVGHGGGDGGKGAGDFGPSTRR